MKTNIALVSLNFDHTRQLCKDLADQLDMLFADINDILEYNMVNQQMLDMAGKEYFDKEEKKVLASVVQCNNACICCKFEILNKNSNFDVLKSNCLVIFLEYAKSELKNSDIWQKQSYAFDVENSICKKNADISIKFSKNKNTTKDILQSIKKFYNM